MEIETNNAGILESLRRIAATVLAIFKNRLGLLSVEIQEERIRIFDALLLAVIMVGFAFLGIGIVTVVLMVFIWKHFGLGGLLVLSGVDLLIAVIIYGQLRQRLKNWKFLSGTIAELKKDCECFGIKN